MLQTTENIKSGMSPEEARRQATLKFGAVESIKEDYRDNRGLPHLEQLSQDIRYATSGFRRNPGFTIVAVLTLALGIGLTTAVFSVVNAVLLNPLPYADADRIVLVRETFRELGNASVGHFHDWTEHNTVFDHTAAGQPVTYNLSDDGGGTLLTGITTNDPWVFALAPTLMFAVAGVAALRPALRAAGVDPVRALRAE